MFHTPRQQRRASPLAEAQQQSSGRAPLCSHVSPARTWRWCGEYSALVCMNACANSSHGQGRLGFGQALQCRACPASRRDEARNDIPGGARSTGLRARGWCPCHGLRPCNVCAGTWSVYRALPHQIAKSKGRSLMSLKRFPSISIWRTLDSDPERSNASAPSSNSSSAA